MSTKVTLTYGPNFHLYQEIFDCGNVYLQVTGHEFEVSNDEAMIQIPIEVWNKIIEDWPKAKNRFIVQDAKDWTNSLTNFLENAKGGLSKPSDEAIIFKKKKRDK